VGTRLSPQEFVAKWRGVTLKERSASQSHFNDLCALLGTPSPVEADPTGTWYTFEAGAPKLGGGEGFADVWKRGFFAWEYKGPHADLDKAYQQLLKYRESLENPPLLVVSDTDRIVIHTNFTNTVKHTETITIDDLLNPAKLKLLQAVFEDPDRLRPDRTPDQVTQEAAAHFAELASLLRKYGEEPRAIAHFLIQLLFCLFAEDTGLLPHDTFTDLVHSARRRPDVFGQDLAQLFAAMSTGGRFAMRDVPRFDGKLFDEAQVLPLDSDGLDILAGVVSLDWSAIEPSILGTLFERSLDPAKRSQLGAHYTSRQDIELIVEPVLMAPLRERWAQVKARAEAIARKRDQVGPGRSWQNLNLKLQQLLQGFAREISSVRVLDPACGSGNFLYVALRQMLDLWNEVSTLAFQLKLPGMQPLQGDAPHPAQLYGIEINEYAHELAQTTVWIGYLQWMHDNGWGAPSEPILKPLQTIVQMDAILAHDASGRPAEPEWPDAEVIIGNPPFLGGGKIRSQLGDDYTDALFRLYAERIPNFSDLCCYWFEKARAMIASGKTKRAGLLATQGIRGGANRRVLERIKQAGDIFWAWGDREWVLDGAMVHVSMVAFDDGREPHRELDAQPVTSINAALQSGADITQAQRLTENAGLAFIGDTKKGKFEMPAKLAHEMLSSPRNPNGRRNTDVIRPWINGMDLTGRPRRMYIIDFGVDMSQAEASLYERPFEYVRQHVKPERDKVRNARERRMWWIHGRAAPELRQAVEGLGCYIATPRVAKHRVFVQIPTTTLPDGQVVIIARQDHYCLGVLQSRIHELWARAVGTQLRDAESGFRYSQTLTFETFPFPWPPGEEPKDDLRVLAIAQAARELLEKRDAWLNPPGASAAELKKRTLTNLYNRRPTWLDLAHRKLDEAVLAAYGWRTDLSDNEILARLLQLNLERAKATAARERHGTLATSSM
jgi:type II restriction/modification system DNA methylase subunit YeeA